MYTEYLVKDLIVLAGLNDPYGSVPTQDVLWFYLGMSHLIGIMNTHNFLLTKNGRR